LDGGEQESDGEVMAETDDLIYECAPRQKHPILFDEPIALYVIIFDIIYENLYLIFFSV